MRRWLAVLVAAGATVAQQPDHTRLQQAFQLTEQAEQLVQRERGEQALPLLEQALLLGEQAHLPDPAPYQDLVRRVAGLRGRALLAAGRLEEAGALFEELLGRYPAQPESAAAMLGLAQIAERQGDEATSERWCAELIKACPQSGERLAAEHLRVARDLRAGRTGEASDRVTDLLREWPSAVHLLWLVNEVAQRRRETGDLAGATELLRWAVEAFGPTRIGRGMRRPLAELLAQQGQLDEALALSTAMREDAPELDYLTDATLFEAMALWDAGRRQEAADRLRALAERYPGTFAAFEAHSRLAEWALASGDPRSALEAAGAMLEQFTQPYWRVGALTMLIQGQLAGGDLGLARQAADELLDLAPGDPGAGWPLIALCETLRQRGMHAEAVEFAQAVAEVYEGPPIGTMARAIIEAPVP